LREVDDTELYQIDPLGTLLFGRLCAARGEKTNQGGALLGVPQTRRALVIISYNIRRDTRRIGCSIFAPLCFVSRQARMHAYGGATGAAACGGGAQ
jgi:hypothetical protein